MSDFLSNLFRALFVVAREMESMTFEINQATLSLMDVAEYAGILTIVMAMIREISYNGAFSYKKKKNFDRLSGGVGNNGD